MKCVHNWKYNDIDGFYCSDCHIKTKNMDNVEFINSLINEIIQLKKNRKYQKFLQSIREWIDIDIKDLRVGDIIRIYDNGIRYADSETKNNIWVVDSDPYINNGIWTINTLY